MRERRQQFVKIPVSESDLDRISKHVDVESDVVELPAHISQNLV